uniref:Cytochrome P450 n=1 Tax=Leersia perrieri TaxID=77586 RepID=A0A0D9XJ62_9ORYZ
MVAAEWAWWLGLLAGTVPLLGLAVYHFTDAFYCAIFAITHMGRPRAKLPPGHMGLPFIGETLTLLWYFKLARRPNPDAFVEAKRRCYGGGVDVYRTHLYGSPAVLVCSPAANKFVFQSPDSFAMRWPRPELVGFSSIANVHGSRHARVRRFVVGAINSPNSLRTIAEVVQPRLVAALRSWAGKGTIAAATEIKKPSLLTEKIDEWVAGLVPGFRAFPLDIPGTTFHHARKCRRKLNSVFREELERRKVKLQVAGEKSDDDCDLMSGLMQMKDEQGNRLSDNEVVDNIVSLVIGGYE